MEKCIFIGDLHFKVSNMDIVDAFIEQILDVVDKEVADCKKLVCVLGGDCLDTHERLHQTPYNKMIDFIDSLRNKCEVIILVGNHDYISNQEFLSKNHWMNPLKYWKNVTIADKVIKKYDCIFMPYVYPGRFFEALDTVDNWKNAKCIFAHQELRGCNLQGDIVSRDGDKWSLDYPQIVSGHIHKPHFPQKNIFYPGSVIQHSFGEEKNSGGGIVVIDFFDDPPYLAFKPVASKIPSLKTIKINADLFETTVNGLSLSPLERVRIVCTGTADSFKKLKRSEAFCNISKNIVVRFQNTPFYLSRNEQEHQQFDSVETLLKNKLKTCSLTERVYSHIMSKKNLDDLMNLI